MVPTLLQHIVSGVGWLYFGNIVVPLSGSDTVVSSLLNGQSVLDGILGSVCNVSGSDLITSEGPEGMHLDDDGGTWGCVDSTLRLFVEECGHCGS